MLGQCHRQTTALANFYVAVSLIWNTVTQLQRRILAFSGTPLVINVFPSNVQVDKLVLTVVQKSISAVGEFASLLSGKGWTGRRSSCKKTRKVENKTATYSLLQHDCFAFTKKTLKKHHFCGTLMIAGEFYQHMLTSVAKVRVSCSTQEGADKPSFAQYPKCIWTRLRSSGLLSTTQNMRDVGLSDP